MMLSNNGYISTTQLLRFADLEAPHEPLLQQPSVDTTSEALASTTPETSAQATCLPQSATETDMLGATDVQRMVRQTFAMLASRCMDPNPAARPGFRDISEQLDIMRRLMVELQLL
jgi:hypothetical protein